MHKINENKSRTKISAITVKSFCRHFLCPEVSVKTVVYLVIAVLSCLTLLGDLWSCFHTWPRFGYEKIVKQEKEVYKQKRFLQNKRRRADLQNVTSRFLSFCPRTSL